MNLKSILLFNFGCVVLVSGRREGSGDLYFDDSDFEFEGSGDDLDKLLLLPDGIDDDLEEEYDIKFEQDYDDDLNYYISEDYEDDLTLEVDDDSLLNLAEIESKPEVEKAMLETSHILIMVGSAFVSFGVAMLSFFLCRRSLEKRREKMNAVTVEKSKEEEQAPRSPIVKDYQRVPTDTKEFLQNQDTHIDMYRDDEEKQKDPLI